MAQVQQTQPVKAHPSIGWHPIANSLALAPTYSNRDKSFAQLCRSEKSHRQFSFEADRSQVLFFLGQSDEATAEHKETGDIVRLGLDSDVRNWLQQLKMQSNGISSRTLV